MSVPANSTAGPSENISLRITRLFDAPPQRVFDAWLDLEQFARWVGPRDHVESVTPVEHDPRVGGRYRVEVHQRNIPEAGCCKFIGGVYREITRFTRLVFTWGWNDDPTETLITVTFRPVGHQTEMTLVHERFDTTDRRDGHQHGWGGSFDQLAALLASNDE